MMDLRRFNEEKWVRNGKIGHFWAEPTHWYRYQKWVPGTGTHSTEGKWYRYPFTREGLVPVPNKGVPIPMLPTTLFLHTLHF